MTVKPRLWIASELYYPEETSTGYFVTRIAEGLVDEFDVRVISGLPTYSERDRAVASREQRAGTHISRMWGTRFDKDRLLLRVANLVTFSLSTFWFALRHLRRGDLVMVLTNPPTLPLVLLIAGRIRGARLTVLVHDVYPEVLVATGHLKRSGRVYRTLAKASSWLFRAFDRVYVLGRDMADIFAEKMGDRADRIALIPNWADLDDIAPVDASANRVLAEAGLAGKTIVQFSGNLGRTHDVETVLGAAAALRGNTAVQFLFVGYGGKSSLIRTEATRRELHNVTFMPRQPRERLSEMLSTSHLTVIAFVDQMYGISVPSRMYNVLAAGKPIAAIAHPQSELALTVRENAAGWVIGDPDAPTLTALIEQLATAEGLAEATRRGASARAAAIKRYSLRTVLSLYVQEFRALSRVDNLIETPPSAEEVGIGEAEPIIEAGLRRPSHSE